MKLTLFELKYYEVVGGSPRYEYHFQSDSPTGDVLKVKLSIIMLEVGGFKVGESYSMTSVLEACEE